jgi:hypothetical protein
MFAALRAIRRPRARSSAGARRSRTAFCSRTITFPVISKPGSRPSSSTTITGRYRESLQNLTPADAYIGRGPDHHTRNHQTATIAKSVESRLNSNQRASASPRSSTAQIVPNHLKTDTVTRAAHFRTPCNTDSRRYHMDNKRLDDGPSMVDIGR